MRTLGFAVGHEEQVVVVVEPLGVGEDAVVGRGELLGILVARRAGTELPDDDDAAEAAHPGEEVVCVF